MIALFRAVAFELRDCRCWPQLKKKYTFRLEFQRTNYQLPADFYCALEGTHWDQGNRWQMQGPMSDSEWNYRTYGYVTIENRKAYRVFGPDIANGTSSYGSSNGGQFQISPPPGAGDVGRPISFEYISRSFILPIPWIASTVLSLADGNYYRSYAGNIYKTSANGTTGTIPPTVAFSVGQDGGVSWLALAPAAWGATTAYSPGDYVTKGGNLYQCSVQGISGSTGPSGTGTALIVDGGVSWYYVSAPAWAAETLYAYGAHVLCNGTTYMRAVTPTNQASASTYSGKVQPSWTATTHTDGPGGMSWVYQDAPRETIISDDDFCLFDEEIMTAGFRYRLMRSRGLEFESAQAEYEALKGSAVARYNAGKKICFSDGYGLAGLNPNVPSGNFTL